MSTPHLYAYFNYEDARAAMRWLEQAFGFETLTQFDDADGAVMHGEMRLGEAIIMIGTAEEPYDKPAVKGTSTGHGTYVAVSEVEGLFARAQEAGARVIAEPTVSEWGNHSFRVLDVEGYEWTFGTYRPGQARDWAGD